jgi:hypothetical protein
MPRTYIRTGKPVGRPRGHRLSQATKDAIGRANRRAWAIRYGEIFPCSCGEDLSSYRELERHVRLAGCPTENLE